MLLPDYRFLIPLISAPIWHLTSSDSYLEFGLFNLVTQLMMMFDLVLFTYMHVLASLICNYILYTTLMNLHFT